MHDNILFDIAIAGGGLAGLCLAIQSADKGYSVVLFEKEEYPFHKVCGEYISLESWDFLERLGVPLSQWELPLIKKLQTSAISGKLYNFDLDLGGFGISRFKLDDYLYRTAVAKGVVVLTKTKVLDIKFVNDGFEIKTVSDKFYSKIAAGSFGKKSNLDIKWKRNFALKKQGGLDNYIGVKYHILYDNKPGSIALHNFYNGYCGISSIEDNKCCLCYLTTAANLKQSGNSIRTMEQKFLSKNPYLKMIFAEAEFLYDKPLTISQVSFSRKSQVENGILLMGDAAGMITPLCGNGMSMAMHGSKLVFESFDLYLQKKMSRRQMEKEYVLKWTNIFAKRLWVGRRVQQLFGGNYSTALFLQTMNKFPALAQKLIKATHGNAF